jgi:hypothetical protein
LNEEEVTTLKMRMYKDAKGIIHTKYYPQSECDIESAKEEIKFINQLTDGKGAPCIVDITKVKSVTREARLYYSSEVASHVISAAALLVDSQVSKVLANFFLGINKPLMPVRLFNSEEQAMEWLNKYV